MKRIDTAKLETGMLVTGRNNKTLEGKLIRLGVHSFTNHNAMVVSHEGVRGIAEAVPPVSKVTSIYDYEKIINEGYLVRFYRHKALDKKSLNLAGKFFVKKLLGLKYPYKPRMVILGLPIYNAIIDKMKWLPRMRLTWCSQLVKRAYCFADPHCIDGYGGKDKELFTPKTFENRIMLGLFDDVTDSIIYDDEQG